MLAVPAWDRFVKHQADWFRQQHVPDYRMVQLSANDAGRSLGSQV
jgi:hypothetical protein